LLTIAALIGYATYLQTRVWQAESTEGVYAGLVRHDPVAFQHARDGNYKVARLLEGRSDIEVNTDFKNEILATRESFSMFANTFGSYRNFATEFEAIVKNGAQLRVVVTDFSEGNRANWQAFIQATEDVPGAEQEMRANAASIRAMIHELAQRYPGKVQLRLNRQSILHTLWVRDPFLPSGLAHLGIHFYKFKSNWPAIRVSQATGGQELATASTQFETIWGEAIPEVLLQPAHMP
jgi:hypothetical protein